MKINKNYQDKEIATTCKTSICQYCCSHLRIITITLNTQHYKIVDKIFLKIIIKTAIEPSSDKA